MAVPVHLGCVATLDDVVSAFHHPSSSMYVCTLPPGERGDERERKNACLLLASLFSKAVRYPVVGGRGVISHIHSEFLGGYFGGDGHMCPSLNASKTTRRVLFIVRTH